MHLPFIVHTHAHQMYVTTTCTRLKRAFHFISCQIVMISVQDDGDGCKSTYFEGWTTSASRVFSKQYTFVCYRASQSMVSTRWSPFTIHVKCIVISVYLNSMLFNFVYWIICEIKSLWNLLYVTFLTTKFSRSTV